jgi:hypothetical protein
MLTFLRKFGVHTKIQIHNQEAAAAEEEEEEKKKKSLNQLSVPSVKNK